MPSLVSLRAFEAAARLGSFKDAAEELSVTPTAVSHHVRGLEKALDAQLFLRVTRGVRLTDAGRQLAGRLTLAFSEIVDALSEVRTEEHVLTVTTTPAFAALWLVPRLDAFHREHSEIRLRIDTGTAPVDLQRDRRIDLAIRYGAADGNHVVRTFQREKIGLYGAPNYLAGLAELGPATILCTDWQQPNLAPLPSEAWLNAAGSEERPTVRRFDQEHHVAQCAIAGQGLALLSNVLVDDMVARGLLIPYRPEIQVPGLCYSLLCLPERVRLRKIARFLRWLEDAFDHD